MDTKLRFFDFETLEEHATSVKLLEEKEQTIEENAQTIEEKDQALAKNDQIIAELQAEVERVREKYVGV